MRYCTRRSSTVCGSHQVKPAGKRVWHSGTALDMFDLCDTHNVSMGQSAAHSSKPLHILWGGVLGVLHNCLPLSTAH